MTHPTQQELEEERAVDLLHQQIMNLPLPAGWHVNFDSFEELAYKSGHRDARHAAAELVAASSSHRAERIKELEEALRSFVFEFGDKTNSATVNKARAALRKGDQQ